MNCAVCHAMPCLNQRQTRKIPCKIPCSQGKLARARFAPDCILRHTVFISSNLRCEVELPVAFRPHSRLFKAKSDRRKFSAHRSCQSPPTFLSCRNSQYPTENNIHDLCDVLASPDQFNGKLVSIRGPTEPHSKPANSTLYAPRSAYGLTLMAVRKHGNA